MANYYQLGPYHFNTRIEAEGMIKLILQQPCELAGKELEVVNSLYQHSPKRQLIESRGGVKEFVIDDVSSNEKTNRRFMAICKNGDRIDFSARDCLDNYKDEDSKSRRRVKKGKGFFDLVREACRTAIEADIQDFKDKNFVYVAGTHKKLCRGAKICPLSGWIIEERNAHVDHDDPYSFIDIVEMFVKSLGYDIETLDNTRPPELETRKKDIRVRFISEQTSELFRHFHSKYAKLRLVTADANVKRVTAQKAKRKQDDGGFELV